MVCKPGVSSQEEDRTEFAEAKDDRRTQIERKTKADRAVVRAWAKKDASFEANEKAK